MNKGFPALCGLSVDLILSSDHCPVLFDLMDSVQLDNIPHQIVKDYAAADWRRYAALISDRVDLTADVSLDTVQEVDHAISALTESIQIADQSCILRRRIQFGMFGLTSEILALIGGRRAVSRRWQRSRDPALRGRARFLDLAVQKATSNLVNIRFHRVLQRLDEDPGGI